MSDKLPYYDNLIKLANQMTVEVDSEELYSNLITIQNTPLIEHVYALMLHHHLISQNETFQKSELLTEIPWVDRLNYTTPSLATGGFRISLTDSTIKKLIYQFLRWVSN